MNACIALNGWLSIDDYPVISSIIFCVLISGTALFVCGFTRVFGSSQRAHSRCSQKIKHNEV